MKENGHFPNKSLEHVCDVTHPLQDGEVNNRPSYDNEPTCHKGSPLVIGVKSKRLTWTKHDNFEGKCPSQGKVV